MGGWLSSVAPITARAPISVRSSIVSAKNSQPHNAANTTWA
jgi:hypothetical protein